MKQNRRKEGAAGEALAAEYLVNNGYNILERNYHFEHAEIDLIAEDGDELVFVEVKARTSKVLGDPEDAMSEEREDHVRDAADGYLFEKGIEDRVCRFDVVAVEFENGLVRIRHTKDAF